MESGVGHSSAVLTRLSAAEKDPQSEALGPLPPNGTNLAHILGGALPQAAARAAVKVL
jgi:hypothetical protein